MKKPVLITTNMFVLYNVFGVNKNVFTITLLSNNRVNYNIFFRNKSNYTYIRLFIFLLFLTLSKNYSNIKIVLYKFSIE